MTKEQCRAEAQRLMDATDHDGVLVVMDGDIQRFATRIMPSRVEDGHVIPTQHDYAPIDASGAVVGDWDYTGFLSPVPDGIDAYAYLNHPRTRDNAAWARHDVAASA